MFGLSPMGAMIGAYPAECDYTILPNTGAALGVGDICELDLQFVVATNFDLGDPVSAFAKAAYPTAGGILFGLHAVALATTAAGAEGRVRAYGIVPANVLGTNSQVIARGGATGLQNLGFLKSTNRNLNFDDATVSGTVGLPLLNTTRVYKGVTLETCTMASTAAKQLKNIFFVGWPASVAVTGGGA